MGKVWIVADTTYRETARQPIYYILTLFFAGLIYFSRFFTLFGFREGDEQNMIREMGIASITMCGMLLSVILSSVVITSEVEKLTTLTVLSKPISRGQFLLGKYFGLILANVFSLTFLFVVLVYTLWVKEVFPKLEDLPLPTIPLGEVPALFGPYADLSGFVSTTVAESFKGTILSFFQVAILTSIGVAIAPHFSLVVNGTASFLLFAMGHLTQYIQLRSDEASFLIKALVQVVCLIVPNLGYFNAASLLSTRSAISYHYVAASGAYGALYIAVVLAVASVLFSRKEVK